MAASQQAAGPGAPGLPGPRAGHGKVTTRGPEERAMKGKIALLVGGAVGYVLGTRAGRQRYEQIKGQAQKVWQNPTVQQKATQAQDFAKEKAPEARHKVAEAAASATAA